MQIKLYIEPGKEWKTKKEVKDKDGNVVMQNGTPKMEELKKPVLEIMKDQMGNVQFTRNDCTALNNLLNMYDTRLHHFFKTKSLVSIRKKLLDLYYSEPPVEKDTSRNIELNDEELKFLKNYIQEFPKSEGKNLQMPEFLHKTFFSIYEQIFTDDEID